MSYFVAGAIALAAAAGTAYNTNQTENRQDRQLATSLRLRNQHDREANKQVKQLIHKTAKSTDTDEKKQSLGQYMQALHASQGKATQPLSQVGNVSDAYTKQANDAALGVADYGANQAGMLASIDAPLEQRQNESFNNLAYGTNIHGIERQAAGDDFLNNLKLRQIRRNPWIDFAANAAMGYAGARVGNAGSSIDSSGAGDWSMADEGLTNGAGVTQIPAGSFMRRMPYTRTIA